MEKENIEKMLRIDSLQKKRIGRGVYSRASRLGYIKGGVKTQYDYLTAKERKKLNGEVRISYMYENESQIPSIEEIKKMNFEKGQQTLKLLRSRFSNTVLRKKWEISNGGFYKLLDEFEIEMKPRSGGRRKKEECVCNSPAQIKQGDGGKSMEEILSSIMDEGFKKITEKIKDNTQNNGFTISLNGKYGKKEIEERILGISSMLMDGSEYQINITIKEEKNEMILDEEKNMD